MPPSSFKGLQNTIIIAQGKKGSGKTNAVKTETEELEPIYFIDIRNEYRHTGVRKVRSVNEFKHDLLAFQHNRIPRDRMTRISFTFGSRREYLELFELMKGFTNCTIVIDEADSLFQDRKLEQGLIDMMLGARNNNVNLVYCSKRPFLIPISVRSQADIFLVFRTKEKRDVAYLENMATNGFPKSPKTLKQGECLVIVDGVDEIEVRQYEKFVEKKVKENV